MPERVDAPGETVRELDVPAMILQASHELNLSRLEARWLLDTYAAARQRLDHAEKILRSEGK